MLMDPKFKQVYIRSDKVSLSNEASARSGSLVRISWRIFTLVTIWAYYIGLVGSLLLTLTDRDTYSRAIHTHCHNKQFLPSISACLALRPQIYLFRLVNGLVYFHRFIDALLYFFYYMYLIDHQVVRRRIRRSDIVLVYVLLISFLVRYLFLLLLTFVSSIEDHDVHETAFIIHALASLVSMFSNVMLHWRLFRGRALFDIHAEHTHHGSLQNVDNQNVANDISNGLSAFENSAHQNPPSIMSSRTACTPRCHGSWSYSFSWKVTCLALHLLSLLVALFLFVQHNSTCGDYLFSFFAFFEWVAVLAGVSFHWATALDFPHAALRLG